MGAIDERSAGLILDLGNLDADGGLRLVTPGGSQAEAPVLADRDKSLQIIRRDVHRKNKPYDQNNLFDKSKIRVIRASI